VALVAAQPPSDIQPGWTVEPLKGLRRVPAPEIAADGTVTGTVAWVPDVPGADVLVVVGADGRAAVVEAEFAQVEPVTRYDATRALGHVAFDGARGDFLDLREGDAATAWYLAQTFIAAESLGASDLALQTSVQYAKERFTFGRAIGSYQAIKHQLVEMLRLADNARSLMYYAGWAGEGLRTRRREGRVTPASSRSPHPRSASPRGRPSSTPPVPRSTCTAASAPHGSTTRRCSSAAPSSPGGFWAARPGRPTAWRASCSRRRSSR
jgi:hypothetical protein